MRVEMRDVDCRLFESGRHRRIHCVRDANIVGVQINIRASGNRRCVASDRGFTVLACERARVEFPRGAKSNPARHCSLPSARVVPFACDSFDNFMKFRRHPVWTSSAAVMLCGSAASGENAGSAE